MHCIIKFLLYYFAPANFHPAEKTHNIRAELHTETTENIDRTKSPHTKEPIEWFSPIFHQPPSH